MLKIKDILFVGSFGRAGELGYGDLPEYAWAGRSNVGKSSLVNYVLGRRQMARVSVRAGKTLRLNQYVVDKSWSMVDMPGYGWAQVSKALRKDTQAMRMSYLKNRTNLVVLFVLIDCRHVLEGQDQAFLAEVLRQGLPLALVFTKADKLSKSALHAHIQTFCQAWGKEVEACPRFMTSSLHKQGREELLAFIESQNRAYHVHVEARVDRFGRTG